MAEGVEIGTGYISIIASAKGIGGQIERQVGGDLDRAGKKAGGRFSGGMMGAVGAMATKVFAPLLAIDIAGKVAGQFTSSISAASDLNETLNKSNVIFGDQAGKMDAWAQNAAKSFGLSKAAALEAAAGYGDMFSQLGFGKDQAAEMSQQTIQLATDLGSFNNLPTAEVNEMIAASFRGEYDSLQRVIPNINAARVETEALAATGKKSAKELTAQEKAAATLAIIQKDGARAAGDFANTQDGLANKQKIVAAQWEDLKAKMGQAFLPVAEAVMGFLGDRLLPGLEQLGGAIGPLGENIQSLWNQVSGVFSQNLPDGGGFSVLAQLGPTIQAAWGSVVQWVQTALWPALQGIGTALQNAYAVIAPILSTIGSLWASVMGSIVQRLAATWPQIQAIFAQIGQIIVVAMELIRATIDRVVSVIRFIWENWGTQIVGVFRAIWTTVANILVAAWNAILGILRPALDVVKNVIGLVMNVIKGDWGAAWENIKGIFFGVWEVIKGILFGALGIVKAAIAGAWDVVKSLFSLLGAVLSTAWRGLWSGIVSFAQAAMAGIINYARGWLNGVLAAFVAVGAAINSVWNGLWGFIARVQAEVMSRVRGGIDSALGGIRNAFSEVVGAISRKWGELREAAAAPVRFVVNTVYGGIRRAYNSVAGMFGGKTLPDLSFATGGILPGYTPGRDVHQFYSPTAGLLGLSGGEAIMRPEFVKALGPRMIELLNHLARTGGVSGIKKAMAGMHFAGGGIVNFRGVQMDAASAGMLFMAEKLAGQAFRATQGSFRPATSYSGSTHTGAGAIDIAYPNMRQVIGLRSVGSAAWDRTGKGNWIPHIHAVFPVPGLARSAAAQYADYLRGGDGLGGRDNGPRGLMGKVSAGMMDALANMPIMPGGGFSIRGLFDSALAGVRDKIGGTPFGDMIASVPGKMVDLIVDKAKDLIPGFASGGVTPGGPAWVGERGAEIMVPSRGSRVIGNTEARHAVEGGGTGRPFLLQIQLDGRTVHEQITRINQEFAAA